MNQAGFAIGDSIGLRADGIQMLPYLRPEVLGLRSGPNGRKVLRQVLEVTRTDNRRMKVEVGDRKLQDESASAFTVCLLLIKISENDRKLVFPELT